MSPLTPASFLPIPNILTGPIRSVGVASTVNYW